MSNEKTAIDLGSYRLVKLDRYNYEMEELRGYVEKAAGEKIF